MKLAMFKNYLFSIRNYFKDKTIFNLFTNISTSLKHTNYLIKIAVYIIEEQNYKTKRRNLH